MTTACTTFANANAMATKLRGKIFKLAAARGSVNQDIIIIIIIINNNNNTYMSSRRRLAVAHSK